jgi:hypothetical protein
MDTAFNLEIDLTINPHWWRTKPVVTYGIDDLTINTVTVTNNCTFRIVYPLTAGAHSVWIEFKNKDYADCIMDQNLDMAIEIQSVSIEGMTLDRFKWAAEYHPDYPEWLTNQPPVIKSATYLGWNGRWVLPFTTPIFTWIHQLENLGWLYPVD